MIPKSYKKLRGLAMGYGYRLNIDADGILTWAVSNEYDLAGELNHEIFNIAQWMPLSVKMDINYKSLRPISFWEKYLMHWPMQTLISPQQYFMY